MFDKLGRPGEIVTNTTRRTRFKQRDVKRRLETQTNRLILVIVPKESGCQFAVRWNKHMTTEKQITLLVTFDRTKKLFELVTRESVKKEQRGIKYRKQSPITLTVVHSRSLLNQSASNKGLRNLAQHGTV